MPYFQGKSDSYSRMSAITPQLCKNILYIHVPKTGGTSIEHYLAEKYDISLNADAIFSKNSKVTHNGISYHHLSYSTIIDEWEKGRAPFSAIDFTNLDIWISVRNPYDRLFSNLFFLKLMNSQSTTKQVFEIIRDDFLPYNHLYDNHVIPQSVFYIGLEEQEHVTILRQESLNEDMYNLGFSDFDKVLCKSFHIKEYREFYSKETIQLINDYYFMDFELFGYKMLNPSDYDSCV
jgi:hypothetical protein